MIRIKIDEKSLFYGLYNDYVKGQTATVSTPINQSKDPNKWHKDIISLYSTGLDIGSIPEDLLDKCLTKTTAKANSKINYFYSFDNLFLDGEKLDVNSSFGFYIKEEIDEFITKRDGSKGKNTHLGRQKLHYPVSLNYHGYGLNIDNAKVLDAILDKNGGFAFVVRGFEIDVDKKTLNFITSMIGLKGILLSNVFRKKKGVGKKLLVDDLNLEAQDISQDSYVMLSKVNPEKSKDTNFDALSKVRAENGKLGEQYAFDHIKELINEYIEDVVHVSKDYPTSPYDIEYMENGVKKFLEVKATSGTKGVFNMSSGEIKFMTKYKDNYTLILITEVKEAFPKTKSLKYDNIVHLKKEYPSTRFFL